MRQTNTKNVSKMFKVTVQTHLKREVFSHILRSKPGLQTFRIKMQISG